MNTQSNGGWTVEKHGRSVVLTREYLTRIGIDVDAGPDAQWNDYLTQKQFISLALGYTTVSTEPVPTRPAVA